MHAFRPPLQNRLSAWLAAAAVAAWLLSACGGGAQSAPTVPAKLAPTPASGSASPGSASPTVPSPAVPSPSPAAKPAAAASPVGSPAALASPAPSPAASPAAIAPPSRKLSVVATTTQIQDFVRNVGGDRIEVVPILSPLTDPHDYQPTAEDARKFAQADAIFYNGVGLEPWLEDLAKNARSGVPVINLAEAASLQIEAGADHAEGEEHDEEKPGETDEHEEGDPHVWYDPINVQKMVNVIRDTLVGAESPGAPIYQANAAAYNRELDRLDQQIKQQIASVPESQRKLVTSHESYGYYVARYGLELVGTVIPSTSTEAEPSAGDLQELIQKIRRENVKAIFTQRGQNPRLEQQIAQQARVNVVSDLYAESLGPQGSDGDTYIKAMLHDTRVITEALR